MAVRATLAALLTTVALAASTFAGPLVPVARAAELVMLEEAGCPWCEAWNRTIGPIYPRTPEGRRAPLRRVDIHAPLPDDLAWLVTGGYTPTFVLVEGGREIGRIRGYPGEDFFWGLLGEMIDDLDASPAEGSPDP